MALRLNRGQQTTRSSSISSARDANNSASGTSKTNGTSMKFVQKYLDECRSFYSCIYCRTHLANHDELISRSFQGNRSRAYLFNSVINVSCGPSVQRELNTGSHSVADIFCTNCGTTIGWKYEKAFVDSQKYKEGKYIIELAHVVRENRHLELDKRDIFLGLATAPPKRTTTATTSQPGAATIGINHQNSLSPVSRGGQWSPGTSSSSSSSSSPSPNDDKISRPTCRYASSSQASPDDQQRFVIHNDDDDDIEDDEVLMFPFYDDLYGNRSSYSNLSSSRSYQKRLRRSLYLDAAPYDWKYAHGAGSCSSSSVSPTASKASPSSQQNHHQQQQQEQQQQPQLESQPNLFASSSSSIEIPVNQASQTQSDNSSRHQLAANRRFFASTSSAGSPPLPPLENILPQPTSSASLAGARCDTDDNSSEPATGGRTSPRGDANSINRDDDDHGDTQFEFEHDKQVASATNESSSSSSSHNQAGRTVTPFGGQNCDQLKNPAQVQANLEHSSSKTNPSSTQSGGALGPKYPALNKQSVVSMNARTSASDEGNSACETLALDNSEASSSSVAAQSIRRTNSLSFDDDEFYDCSTDHDVSNSPLKTK